MDGRDELIDLKNDNEILQDAIEEMRAEFDGLKPLVLDLVGPHDRSRPEVLIALRMLATFAGLPAGCDRRECRRDGACHAEDNPPYCREHWPRKLAAGFADVAAGIELSSRFREQEEADFYAYACEQLGLTPEGKVPRKKRNRKGAA